MPLHRTEWIGVKTDFAVLYTPSLAACNGSFSLACNQRLIVEQGSSEQLSIR